MTKILMAGLGRAEILRRERDLPISTGGMRDSQSKLDGGMQDEKNDEIHRLRIRIGGGEQPQFCVHKENRN